MTALFSSLLFLASIGAGLNAGLFFIFSVCVMAALGKLSPAEGMTAMNTINTVIQNALFFVAFMGTALLALVIVLLSLFTAMPGSALAVTGAVVFLVGTIGVTIGINVPMNNALAAADPGSQEGIGLWKDYLVRWTNWNHVRSLSSLAALALLVLAYAEAANA